MTPPDATGTFSGCTTVDRELVKAAISKDPGAYDVNLHPTGYTAGALRGQLS